ncbi:hypothetical protein BQ8482_100189 [Mesorhizobium delmotii]|uniref:Uncharacterized protein n=1 Tax=Mesorhizobium delmotii TaxID=1631247 RepID=A0A2P9AA50_9HYPH|nr:hypothetical protein BQ8482_100189 [Mesorhizobium delmotii]
MLGHRGVDWMNRRVIGHDFKAYDRSIRLGLVGVVQCIESLSPTITACIVVACDWH